ncbi:TetR/AcrR family transcriptional regulator [Insolitispirillum peregrinum]|uniref:TetR/AcrR family transcriptional regulator n=1 Tax=Insolitispirillum peregrinum TaxID=80876 RepID=UPI00361256B6
MRITKEQKQENHDRIVAIASEMFREHGYDGVGIAELMERAGLTHGGFYNHFRSKEDLIAQATQLSFDEASQRYADIDARAVIDFYISRAHRDQPAIGCPVTTLGCEAARQTDATRAIFGNGIEVLLANLVQDMARNGIAGPGARSQAITILARAAGAVILSRACPDESALADEILEACRLDCHDSIISRSQESTSREPSP